MRVVSTSKLRTKLREDLVVSFPDAHFDFYPNIKDAEQALPDAEVLITYGEDLTDREIQLAGQLKWIMVISAGLEKMPLKAIKEKGIIVTNARGIHKIPMAEYTFTTLLNVAKNTRTWFENQNQAKWDRRVNMEELSGQLLTIIGAGAIGSEIARLAKAFGMKTLGVNRSGSSVSSIDTMYTIEQLQEACRPAKYIVSILPETQETYRVIDKDIFDSMRKDAVFINIGRGKTVDQKALLTALENGQIAHAVLDVFEEEPLPADHPFWKMENVTVTPHFSSVTANYQPRALDIFKQNLKTYLNGETPSINYIDLDRGY